MKLNDIFTELSEDVDLKDLEENLDLFLDKSLSKNTTKDLRNDLRDLYLGKIKKRKEILVKKLSERNTRDILDNLGDLSIVTKEGSLVEELLDKNTNDLIKGLNDLDFRDKSRKVQQLAIAELLDKNTNDLIRDLEDLDFRDKERKVQGLKIAGLGDKSTRDLGGNFENIDLTDKEKKLQELFVDKLLYKNTKDILNTLNNIDLSSGVELEVSKNRTVNFDALSNNHYLARLKDPIELETIPFASRVFYRIRNFIPFKIWKILTSIYLVLGIVLLGILSFLDKQFVEYRVNQGYKRLIKIKDNPYDVEFVKKQINDAKFDFTISDVAFYPFSFIDALQINNAYHIIKGGKYITKSLDSVFYIYDNVLALIKKENIEDIELTVVLSNLRNEFSLIYEDLLGAMEHFTEVKGLSDVTLQEKLVEQTKKLSMFLKYLDMFNKDFDSVLSLLGEDRTKTYLIAFQNSDEIRPTGGFMGSMGVLKVFKGKVRSFEKKDIYAYEWDLKSVDYNRLPAPEGLDKLTEKFGLRDANYFINVENSSKAINFFVENLGYSVDGVIYINQNILLDFLENTGDVEFKKLGIPITQDNFSEIMSTLVEAKKYKVGTLGTPKKILFDFMEEYVEKLKDEGNYFAYLKLIQDSIEKRDIIFYSFDEDDNKLLKKLGLNMDVDFLKTIDFSYPVFTSLSGNKSDRYIDRSFQKSVFIRDDCTIDTNLKITSKHEFTKQDRERLEKLFEEYDIEDKGLINIQGEGDNYQFVRVLLPRDAVISEKPGLEIEDYEGIKVAEFYIKTRKGETTTYNIDYSLKNKDCKKYDFTFYKQSGIKEYSLKLETDSNIIERENINKDFYYSD